MPVQAPRGRPKPALSSSSRSKDSSFYTVVVWKFFTAVGLHEIFVLISLTFTDVVKVFFVNAVKLDVLVLAHVRFAFGGTS